MVTTVGTERELLDALNNLIALDFDAIDAYQAAINRLENASDQAQLHQFMGDHERHTQELGEIVQELGGTPATKGDIKSVLIQGKVVLGNLPPGTYTIEAWHETLGARTQQVTIAAKEATDVAFTFAR